MAHGIVTPLPRIVGPTDSEISGEIIPAGVSPSHSPFVGSCIEIALRLSCRWAQPLFIGTRRFSQIPARLNRRGGFKRIRPNSRNIWFPFLEDREVAWV